ncbi:MAG: hypothetical protein AMXMBFR58_36440 [Phycisphaerae bacterium]
MTTKITTYLTLPEQVRRMAGMAATRAGVTLSEYVLSLIVEDCRRTGVADLVPPKPEVQVSG